LYIKIADEATTAMATTAAATTETPALIEGTEKGQWTWTVSGRGAYVCLCAACLENISTQACNWNT